MSKTGTVYAIRHNPTGKIYVGSTRNLESRIAAHMSRLRNGHHPCEAMQKDFDAYGDDYSLSILYSGSLEGKDKTQMEHAFMTILNTRDSDVGYNGKDPAKAFDKDSVSWKPVPRQNLAKTIQQTFQSPRQRGGEIMFMGANFPESTPPEMVECLERILKMLPKLDQQELALTENSIYTLATRREMTQPPA